MTQGSHAVLLLDGAGWHQTGGKLRVPNNVSHYDPFKLNPQKQIPISANVTMICGCPINTDPWPHRDFQVEASILHDGKTTNVTLTLDSKAPAPSQFTANWTPGGYGVFVITVWAFQISTGNTGVDHTSVNLQAPSA